MHVEHLREAGPENDAIAEGEPEEPEDREDDTVGELDEPVGNLEGGPNESEVMDDGESNELQESEGTSELTSMKSAAAWLGGDNERIEEACAIGVDAGVEARTEQVGRSAATWSSLHVDEALVKALIEDCRWGDVVEHLAAVRLGAGCRGGRTA